MNILHWKVKNSVTLLPAWTQSYSQKFTQPDGSGSSNIFAIVEGTEVCALIDSGSFVFIVSEDFRNSHPALKKRPIAASTVQACSVSGQRLDI